MTSHRVGLERLVTISFPTRYRYLVNSLQDAASLLRDWLHIRDQYLAEILARYAPPVPQCCIICKGGMRWRCEDCFGEPTYCTRCCREVHHRIPFHRVLRWNGETFYRSSLRKAGLILFLGHHGSPCPHLRNDNVTGPHLTSPPTPLFPPPHDPRLRPDLHEDDPVPGFHHLSLNIPGSPASALSDHLPFFETSESPAPLTGRDTRENSPPPTPASSQSSNAVEAILDGEDVDDFDDDWLRFETGGLTSTSMKIPKGSDGHGNIWLTIVDIHGVQFLPVHFCQCSDASSHPLQLLQLGLYPASHDRPQTAFTFRVLDDFDLENLESKASAERYYTKLKRLSSNAFPQIIPDRYREFLRVMREWRNLKLRKRAGTFRTPSSGDEIQPGGLVLFCPTCPHPGVNLPANWENDPLE